MTSRGAMPAAVGERGCIPGSMGTASVHVEGRGVAEALSSSAHGAGRALPRGVARRVSSVGALERQMAGVFWDRRRAPLLRDEAAAYKDIDAVLRAQRALVRIVRRLEPVLSWK
jgi:tRNA-splicing ligase RtcB